MRPRAGAAVTLTATIDGALLSADDGVVAVPLYIPLSCEALRRLTQDSMEILRDKRPSRMETDQ